MNQGQPSGTPSLAQLSDTEREQLGIIRQSKTYIIFFLAALFLSYLATSAEEKRFLCGALRLDCPSIPNTCPIRITSSLIAFWALIFFYVTASGTVSQPAADSRAASLNGLNYAASLLSLIAGAIRVYTAFAACCPSGPGTSGKSEASAISPAEVDGANGAEASL